MKTKYLILAISLIILSLSGCKKEKDLAAVFTVSDCKETVTATTAKLEATFSYPGNVKKVGVDVSENKDMSEAKHFEATVDGSKLNADVSGLKGNTLYYYRYGNNTGYGTVSNEAKTFKTKDYSLPKLTTSELTDITINSAKCGGNITNDGEAEITERGVCWSKSQNPNINGNHKSNGIGLGSYIVDIDGLEIGVQYYVRAYAKNVKGVSYGNEKSFVTLNGVAAITTSDVTNITATTAKCGGNITNDGGSSITERGVCWSKSQNPTIDGNHKSNGTGLGSYTIDIDGLEIGVEYHVRAYAKNVKGVSYGNEKSFVTLNGVAAITTSDVTNITATTAKCGGNITNDGGSAITERGVCWSKSQNPTIDGNHKSNGTGLGSYTIDIDGLEINTQYNVRAYAKNEKGVSYGANISFKTLDGKPIVVTSSVTEITATSAKCGGNVTDQGASNVTERGVCWGINHNPTIDDNFSNGGAGGGSFTTQISGLTPVTKYYVKAYARNTQGLVYGLEVEFTTQAVMPTVTTDEVINIAATTATCGGNVTNDGGASVTARGICWGISHNPTTSGTHATSGSGTGSFTVNMTGLTKNTTYYVRAYAVNAAGTSYGNEVSFRTLADLPVVSTSSISNITQTSATCGGNVTSDGGATVTARGVCWSTSQNPTTSNSHTTNGSGTGTFTSSLTGLSENTTYYVRAYATNSAGTSYGEQKSFKTLNLNGHAYVDLGLPSGLLWATCNIGATNPEDYGDYYAWGETSPKSNYSWSTYQWCNGSNTTLTKYCTQSSYGYNGFVDNKTVLEPADDAAHVNWGGDWRMPTYDEMVELKNNCTWTWETQGGKNGYRVTGSNNNSIFLPAAGYYYEGGLYSAGSLGYCWSSSLKASFPDYAYDLDFKSGSVYMYSRRRDSGQSVRPVCQLQK